MMKFCPECGALLVGQKFCHECGANISKYLSNQNDTSLENTNFLDFEASANEQLYAKLGLEVENGVLIKYTGKSRELVIPGGIFEIGESVFEKNSTLASVSMSNDVKYIGEKAFYMCINLKTIQLSQNIDDIGSTAFGKCSALKEIILPEKLSEIRDYVFYSCDSLKRIYIPTNVEKIGYNAFMMTNTERIDINNIVSWLNIKFYNAEARPKGNLYLNEKLLTNLVIPQGVKVINDYAFYNQKYLEFVSCPKDLEIIGKYAFSNSGIVELHLNEGLKTIDTQAFSNCIHLKNLK